MSLQARQGAGFVSSHHSRVADYVSGDDCGEAAVDIGWIGHAEPLGALRYLDASWVFQSIDGK
jgi:hypothetical protein